MSKAPAVTEKGKVLDDAVTLFINKQIYSGWEDVRITRELNAAAGDFQVRLTDRWKPEQQSWSVQSGDGVHIHMGKQSVLTGWIDTVNPSFNATKRSIVVSGRSKTCDIVDCSVTGPNQYSDIDLQTLAQKVCSPFEVPVYFRASPGAKFSSIIVKQGETVFNLLDRHARQRKLLMIVNYEGGLEFVNVGGKRAGTEIRQGVNVLSGSANSDKTNRFSEYIVKGQNLNFLGEPEQSSSPEGKFTDEGVTRFRPYVVVNDGTTDGKTAEDRAQYEANIRAAKSLEAEVEVQGWFKQDGNLWEINEEVFCDVGYLGIRRWMLISKVIFNKNSSGTTTIISLIRKDAYDFSLKNTKVKKEDDLSWLKSSQSYQNPSSFVPDIYQRQEPRQ